MKRELNKEQFFTCKENVDLCLSLVDLNEYNLVVEPSAGDGAFSKRIPNCLAIDIEPMDSSIIKQDFLTFTIQKNGKILTIGNPPFGRQSSLAVKFINKAAEYSDTILFILPNSFKKESMINRLNNHVFVEKIIDLKTNSFYFKEETFEIPCSIFLMKVKEETRPKLVKYTTDDFEFTDREHSDDAVRRVGYYAGRLEDKNTSSESSHYFIKWKKENARDKFKSLDFSIAKDTVGARSISKNEIVKVYLRS